MTTEEIKESFKKTVSVWETALNNYKEEHISKQPDEESWSVGQVCQHLTGSTRRIFLVIEKCMAGNQNEHEKKTEAGEKAFATNILSEVKVKVPLAVQATPPQPESIEFIKKELLEIKAGFAKIAEAVGKNINPGKEKHPVLGFMNAKEWLQTIEMHFRHHLKQKEGIDSFLKSDFR